MSTNCRNSKPIAELVASLQGQPYDVLTVEGPEPELVVTETEDELLKNLEEVLTCEIATCSPEISVFRRLTTAVSPGRL